MAPLKLARLRRAKFRADRLATPAAVLVTLALLLLLQVSKPGDSLRLAGFDLLTLLTADAGYKPPITIIGIDEASFAELDMPWPWPRMMHAWLIDQLAAGGASVIAFDVLFAEPGPEEDNRALATAIRNAGNVVLAADTVIQETPHARQRIAVEPFAALRAAGAASGQVGVLLDSDLMVRRPTSASDSFWQVILQRHSGVTTEVNESARLRYLGPAHTLDYLSYYQALQADQLLPDDIFRDRIVIIGLDVKASPESSGLQGDLFAHPFLPVSGSLMPGVEIQATQVANGLNNSFIRTVPKWFQGLLQVLLILMMAWRLRDWRPVSAALWTGLVILLLAAGSGLLFAQRWWLDPLIPSSGLLLLFISLGTGNYFTQLRQRKELRTAFSRYVSPELVNQIVAEPERLVLGGERRELSLMFTDLAGFSTFSETMEPEQLTELLNRYFTEMTSLIREQNGTVDKFIGDAIMAFWGAPLDDPEQCARAVHTAVAMQQRLAELREDGLSQIYMRIGLHVGEVVVGNMGANDRFDYTVMGDAVNLAARLEGINKLYGTEILLSGAIAERVRAEIPVCRIDRVCVKGKSQAEDVYTVGKTEPECELYESLLQQLHQRNWSTVLTICEKALLQVPDDVLLHLYQQRALDYQANPPAADWDGSVALEKY